MKKKLTILNKDAKVLLTKTKNIMKITKDILKLNNDKLIFVNLEATGANKEDRIIQIEYIICDLTNDNCYYGKELCNPGLDINFEAMEVHNITNEMIQDKGTFKETKFYKFLQAHNNSHNYLVVHFAPFRLSMLEKEEFKCEMNIIDTMNISKSLFKDLSNTRLSYLWYALGLYNYEEKIQQELSYQENILPNLFKLKLLFSYLNDEIKKQEEYSFNTLEAMVSITLNN